jgi:hypothetical protein
MKQLTTSSSDHAPDIPGKETTMDFSQPQWRHDYSLLVMREVSGFSAHNNSDMQKTYRIFMDLTGDGWFQEINRGVQWQLPAWVRGFNR